MRKEETREALDRNPGRSRPGRGGPPRQTRCGASGAGRHALLPSLRDDIHHSLFSARIAVGLIGLVAGSILATGCVERLLQVRTQPPGARVWVNGEPVLVAEAGGETSPARTPVDVPFDFYGTFEIRVERAEHFSETRLVEVDAPFYEYPPLDLVLETFSPWTLHDHHPVEIRLTRVPELEDRGHAALFQRMRDTRALLDPPGEETREP